jgi:predicted RNase H-like HicB family nuclease
LPGGLPPANHQAALVPGRIFVMAAVVLYYRAVVNKDEGSAYGVHFPDLPGCFSAADRIEDIFANATVALALWFEDEAGPIEALPYFPARLN